MRGGRHRLLVVLFGGSLVLASPLARAGGPIIVSTDGSPVGWNASAPVPIRHDPSGLGALSPSEAAALATALFQVWEDVPSATIAFQDDGAIAVDVDETNFVAYLGAGGGATAPRGETVVVFDEDGAIFDLLYGVGTSVLGFALPSWLSNGGTPVAYGDPVPPGSEIIEGYVFLNGSSVHTQGSADGLEMPFELFHAVIIHEIGHLIGLDHTQIHGMRGAPDSDILFTYPRETMFPFAENAEQTTLERDDVVALSSLYPTAAFLSSTGRITGRIVDETGLAFSGANVIARNIADDADAVSWVSGALQDDGRFELAGLDPAASYQVEVGEIDYFHRGGSRLRPYSTPRILPGPPESYNGAAESASSESDEPDDFEALQVGAGATLANVDIRLNEQRFEIDNVPVDGGKLQDFAVGEFDGDDALDFVTASIETTGDGEIRFFRGLGDGSFDAPAAIASFDPDRGILAAQLDSGMDAYLDIAVASREEVRVYFGDGTGRFASPVILLSVPAATLRDLVVADLDGDPHPDLVAVVDPPGGPATVHSFLGSANGSFVQVTTAIGANLETEAWQAGDFIGGGGSGTDLIAPSFDPPGVWILAGDGAGGFTVSNTDLSSVIDSLQVRGFATGDFDEDGHLDIGMAAHHIGGPPNHTRSFVQLFRGDGDGGFTWTDRYQAPESFQVAVLGVDVDHDGHLDLVSTGALPNPGSPGAKVTMAFGDGLGGLSEPETVWGLGEFPSGLAAADVDADGRLDLLVNLSRDFVGTIPVGHPSYAVLRALETGPVCGNGAVEAGEECDDGNLLGGDLCSAVCERASVLPVGTVIVGDIDFDRVLAIDPASGYQQVVSQGGSLATPTDIVVESPGTLLVVDRGNVAVLRIDVATGAQEVVTSGGRLVAPRTLVLEPAGTLLVGDASTGEIVRVDPVLGTQSLLVDVGALGAGFAPWAMTLAGPRDLFVLSRFADAVVHVDPSTGAATPLSVGGLLVDPQALASATKGPVVFDFDDWPWWEAVPDLGDGPYLSSYDCEGKGFCSTDDIVDLVGFGNVDSVATTRSGLTATFSRPSGELILEALSTGNGHLSSNYVDDSPDDSAFRMDFSEPVRSARVTISVDWVEPPGPQARFQLEAFDGVGTLVASVLELAAGRSSATLALAHAAGFSAVEFRAFDPDFVPTPEWTDSAFLEADDLVVGLVPWLLVADAGAAAGAAAVVRIDPGSGAQSLLAQGGLLHEPRGIALSSAREIRVLDDAAVVGIDWLSAAQTGLSVGGLLDGSRGITVVPEPGRAPTLATGLLLLGALWHRRRPRVEGCLLRVREAGTSGGPPVVAT